MSNDPLWELCYVEQPILRRYIYVRAPNLETALNWAENNCHNFELEDMNNYDQDGRARSIHVTDIREPIDPESIGSAPEFTLGEFDDD